MSIPDMLQLMITYSTTMLSALGAWLSQGPMLCFFGLICGAFVINFILSFVNYRRE